MCSHSERLLFCRARQQVVPKKRLVLLLLQLKRIETRTLSIVLAPASTTPLPAFLILSIKPLMVLVFFEPFSAYRIAIVVQFVDEWSGCRVAALQPKKQSSSSGCAATAKIVVVSTGHGPRALRPRWAPLFRSQSWHSRDPLSTVRYSCFQGHLNFGRNPVGLVHCTLCIIV